MSKRIVIVGAGITGLESLALLHAHDHAMDAEVVVVAPDDAFAVRALGVGEPFGLGHPHRYPLDGLVAHLGGRHVRAGAREVFASEQRIELDDGSSLDYDALLVAIGARAVPAFEHGVSFDRANAPEAFDDALRDIRDELADDIAVLVPPGLSWTLPAYELALLLRGFEGPRLRVRLVSAEPTPLHAFGTDASERVAQELHASGVTWQHGRVTDVPSETTMLLDGAWAQADRIVHLPLPLGPRPAGLPTDASGFVLVDRDGRVPVPPGGVWAAGDGARSGQGSGSIAAQLAARAVRDVLLALFDHPTPQLPPLTRYGLLRSSTGPLYLRAEVDDPEGTSTWSRSPLWWPPSKVAAPWLTSTLLSPSVRRLPTATAGARP